MDAGVPVEASQTRFKIMLFLDTAPTTEVDALYGEWPLWEQAASDLTMLGWKTRSRAESSDPRRTEWEPAYRVGRWFGVITAVQR